MPPIQSVEWTPRLFLAVCAVAIGVLALTPPDASDASPGEGPGASDATANDACPPDDATPGDDGPGASTWAGPPSSDGSLDDGYQAPFTLADGSALAYLGVASANLPVPFEYTSVKAPYPDAAGCMAFDAQGHTPAHNCLCQMCFALIQQCDALTSCRAILKCSEDTGCVGSSCYLVPPAPCSDVTDNAGGLGCVATALVANLSDCVKTNGCPSQ